MRLLSFILLFLLPGMLFPALGNTHDFSTAEKQLKLARTTHEPANLFSDDEFPAEACLNFGKKENTRTLQQIRRDLFSPVLSISQKQPNPSSAFSSHLHFTHVPSGRMHLRFCVLLC